MFPHSSLDAGIKIRPTEAELKTIGPAFNAKWQSYFSDYPDRSVFWMGVAAV